MGASAQHDNSKSIYCANKHEIKDEEERLRDLMKATNCIEEKVKVSMQMSVTQ